jgi:hypothetical protein
LPTAEAEMPSNLAACTKLSVSAVLTKEVSEVKLSIDYELYLYSVGIFSLFI